MGLGRRSAGDRDGAQEGGYGERGEGMSQNSLFQSSHGRPMYAGQVWKSTETGPPALSPAVDDSGAGFVLHQPGIEPQSILIVRT